LSLHGLQDVVRKASFLKGENWVGDVLTNDPNVMFFSESFDI
jgi:hypothetical protein